MAACAAVDRGDDGGEALEPTTTHDGGSAGTKSSTTAGLGGAAGEPIGGGGVEGGGGPGSGGLGGACGMGGLGGMGPTGAGGGGLCASCQEMIQSSDPTGPLDGLCGWNAQTQSCAPASSCEVYSALFACTCSVSCVAECGNNVCTGQSFTNDCLNCIYSSCGSELALCQSN
jgi:hypothetical protein